jgi:DNA polymerase-3 subunit alpha
VAERKNGEWVKVGGIIASPRRFKTRSGSTMLRAVLDDLDAQVNLVVFEKVLEARAAVLEPDSIVLVRGTVEHGDNGEISIKVADLEGFDASDAEIEKARELAIKAAAPPPPLCLELDASLLPPTVIEDLRRVFGDYPGDTDVVLELETATGRRRLRLGEGYRVAARNSALHAEVQRVLQAARPRAIA